MVSRDGRTDAQTHRRIADGRHEQAAGRHIRQDIAYVAAKIYLIEV